MQSATYGITLFSTSGQAFSHVLLKLACFVFCFLLDWKKYDKLVFLHFIQPLDVANTLTNFSSFARLFLEFSRNSKISTRFSKFCDFKQKCSWYFLAWSATQIEGCFWNYLSSSMKNTLQFGWHSKPRNIRSIFAWNRRTLKIC